MYNLAMKSEANIEFSKRLKAARKAAGLTQQAAADAFGIQLRGYCRWEAGEREPSLAMLVDIADKLDVTTDYLLGREEIAG